MWSEQFKSESWKIKHSDDDDFSICVWQKKKGVLRGWLIYRVLIFLYYFASFLSVVILWLRDDTLSKRDKNLFMIFLSNWLLVLQTLTFLFAMVVTAVDYSIQGGGSASPDKISVVKKIFWFFYTMTLPCTVIVCIGYWAGVYKKGTFWNLFPWKAIGQKIKGPSVLLHITNNIIHVIDFFLVAFPYRFLHFYMPGSLELIYMLFSLIYEYAGGQGTHGEPYIYEMLDWERNPKKTGLYLLAFSVGVFVVHTIFFLFYMMKRTIRKKEDE